MNTEINGTNVASYDSISEFVYDLENSGTKRLHTFTQSGFFGFGGNWVASYVDNKDIVHGFATMNLENLIEKAQPIYDLLKKINIPEVDGIIRVSKRDGGIYQIFQTDAPDESSRLESSLNAWRSAVLDLPTKGTVIQYMKKDSEAIVDATYGKLHFVMALDGKDGRSLKKLLSSVPGYKKRNNTPALDWYSDVKDE